MKRLFGIFSALAILVLCSTGALAQDAPPQGGPPRGGRMQFQQMPTFAELDKNNDKKISKDEFPSRFPPQSFERSDANNDGSIDEEEWNAMRTRFGGGSGYSMGGGPAGGPRTGENLAKFLDGNADGKVSRDEFTKMTSLFDALDKDHNGELSTEELNGFFRTMNEVQAQATGGVELQQLFEKYDKNKDGKITAEEMANDKTFKALDLNKDGEVNRSEADTALRQLKKASDAKKSAQAPN